MGTGGNRWGGVWRKTAQGETGIRWVSIWETMWKTKAVETPCNEIYGSNPIEDS